MIRFFLVVAALFSLVVTTDAFSADEFSVDEPVKAQPKKRRNQKEVQSEQQVEVSPNELQAGFSESDLKTLTDLNAQSQIAEARLKLKTIENRMMELNKQTKQLSMELVEASMAEKAAIEGLTAKEEKGASPKNTTKNRNISRVFPMPGGNPQVVSIIGGNRKALEARLVFPSGLTYDVTQGMLLENGYVVASVSGQGVVLEKDGLRLTMPVSGGKSRGKTPWNEDMGEQGVPVNPVRQNEAVAE